MFPRIRSMILKIPRGQVSTYGAIARAAGYPGAARQVVWALRQSHGLPWHRVVAAGGRIALPREAGMEQRFRLEAEGVRFTGPRVRMKEFEFKFPAARKSSHGRSAGPRRTAKPKAKPDHKGHEAKAENTKRSKQKLRNK
jgi:methylated-DNA-protein-cysteine methyltransferase-like protein